MKKRTHEKRPDIKEVYMTFDPLTIWLTPSIELTIEREDRLGDVAGVVVKHLDLPKKEARKMVAYWFALGERLAKLAPKKQNERMFSEWKRKELLDDPDRRYLAEYPPTKEKKMKTSKNVLAIALLTILAACVDANPVAPQNAPVGEAYVSESGDSLQLLSGGVFKAKLSGYVFPGLELNGKPVPGWIVGTYTKTGNRICAKPNYFAWLKTAKPACGARVNGDLIVDDEGVFLWDATPRRWRLR